MSRTALRDAAVCLSLSSFSLIDAWDDCLTERSAFQSYFFHGAPLDATPELVLVLSTLTLAAITWCGARLVRRFADPLVHRLVSIVLVIWTALVLARLLVLIGVKVKAVGFAIALLTILLTSGYGLAMVVVAYALVTVAVAKRLADFRHCAITAALMLLPCSMLISADLWLRMGTANEEAVAVAPASSVPGTGARGRLVWIIFDEMEERFLSTDRPPGIEMPEFARLRAESLYATQATSNATRTMEAIPSLLTGRPVSEASPTGDAELSLKFEDGTRASLGNGAPNVFQSVRRDGMTVTVVGWYHPYARLFGREVNSAYSHDAYFGGPTLSWSHWSREAGVYRTMLYTLADAFGLAGDADPDAQCKVLQHRQAFADLTAKAFEAAADARYDLVFLHLPVPHLPGIAPGGDYFDNLRIADSVLGQIRERIGRASLSDRTALLVSSDHPLRRMWASTGFVSPRTRGVIDSRVVDRPVPFILKLPGDAQPLVYSGPFRTILSHDLVLALLQGGITTHAQAAHWIASRAAGRG